MNSMPFGNILKYHGEWGEVKRQGHQLGGHCKSLLKDDEL